MEDIGTAREIFLKTGRIWPNRNIWPSIEHGTFILTPPFLLLTNSKEKFRKYCLCLTQENYSLIFNMYTKSVTFIVLIASVGHRIIYIYIYIFVIILDFYYFILKIISKKFWKKFIILKKKRRRCILSGINWKTIYFQPNQNVNKMSSR